ncbi:hypothetical protein F53441_14301 [Fusarium austroafricanum]|uniref:Branched-chain-amino-acid aminotransferase n=1 Tax=Fusarium austroafricanum TaxID=2364996 RepID=A0A8H4JF27_9HYPO|nr:hypothetical protein F53441_14301 [Fusarium austroafricanum]
MNGLSSEQPLDASKLIFTKSESLNPVPEPGSAELWAQNACCDHMVIARWKLGKGWEALELKPYGDISISPAASCLHYATQCFEGMKVYRGYDGKLRLFRPDRNAKRLSMSAQRVSLPAIDEEELVKLVKALVRVDAPRWLPEDKPGSFLYIRPAVIGNGRQIGVQIPAEATIIILMVAWPDFSCEQPPGAPRRKNLGLRLLASENGAVRAWPGGFGNAKVGANYGPSFLSLGECRKRGYDQILWVLGSDCQVTEAGASNFFAIVKNTTTGRAELITPPLDSNIILEGVTRQSVLDLARERLSDQLDVVERDFTMYDLRRHWEIGTLLEVFVSGTAFFISPVSVISFEGKDWDIPMGQAGKATASATVVRPSVANISKPDLFFTAAFVLVAAEQIHILPQPTSNTLLMLPKMAPNQREVQRQLMKQYNIVFDGPIDSIRNPQWPKTCEDIFENIQALGKKGYSQYSQSISADFARTPWKYQVQARADWIADKAKQCIEARKNESGWRLSLESEIMARFTVEIACKKCRGRLWRSEQEVTAFTQPGDDDHDPNSLKARQSRRQPCRCNPGNLNRDMLDQGISPIFDDRAEEGIIYSPELLEEMPKREEKPDRVYGLQATTRFSRLLASVPNIRSNPFKPDGEPIVFPFLVIEAKSEKSGHSFTDTQVQTAFAIRELLIIQQQLAKAAEEDEHWDAGPFVWFLSYRGEHWRVSAAYTQHQGQKTFFVIQLWEGSVNSLNGALQLLLIIDYMADWARDVYREGIARSLQKLAMSDTESLAHDADIFSLAGNIRDWDCGSPETNEVGANQSIQDPLHEFDCKYSAFRDPRFMITRFIGLIITENNVDEFLGTAVSKSTTKKLTTSLLSCIQDSVRVKGYLLDELELLWTDTHRHFSGMTHPDEIFYVVVTSVFYLTEDWEQTRELSYVAVSESLIGDLAKLSDTQLPSSKVLERIPLVESLAVFERLLQKTPRHNLAACISRLCLVTAFTSKVKFGRDHPWTDLPTATEGLGTSARGATVRFCSKPRTREFLLSMYHKHKVGRNEPATSIFRISTSMDVLSKSDELIEFDTFPDPSWPWSVGVVSSLYHINKPVLHVEADSHFEYGPDTGPRICIFVLEGSLIERGVSPSGLETPEHNVQTRLYYQKTTPQKGWNFDDWVNPDSRDSFSHSNFYNRIRVQLQADRLPIAGSLMRKWDILTTGWKSTFETNDESEFGPGRPFRRRPYQRSLKASLLGHKVESGLSIDREVIVIEDDGGPIDKFTGKAPEVTQHPDRGTQEAASRSGMPESSCSRSEPSGSSETRGQKRPIRTTEQNDETEETAHVARQALRQPPSRERWAGDFLTDEELERILSEGGLP